MSSSGALCWMQVQHRRCWQQTDRRTDKRITPSLKVLFLSGAGLITTRVSCILTSSDCNSEMFSRNASYILRLLKALFNTIRRNVFLFFVATNNNSHVRHAPSAVLTRNVLRLTWKHRTLWSVSASEVFYDNYFRTYLLFPTKNQELRHDINEIVF